MRSMIALLIVFCAAAFLAFQSSSHDAQGQVPKEAPKDGGTKDSPKEPAKDGPRTPVKDKQLAPKIGKDSIRKDGPPLKDLREEKFDQKKADIETITTAGLTFDGKSLLEFFQKHTVSDAEHARLVALIAQLGDDDFDRRESASDEIEKFGVAAISFLRQALSATDPEILRRCEICLKHMEKIPTRTLAMAAARLLAVLKVDGMSETMLNYLPLAEDESVADEVRAALAAAAVNNGKPDPVLLKALESKEAVKRVAAAEAFARGGDKPLRAQMRKLIDGDADAEFKSRVALALVTVAKDKTAVEPMIMSLADVSQESGWRVEELLIRLAAEKGPTIALGADKESREKARDAWLKWWQTNSKDVDLSKLDATERMFGYTLVIETDFRGIGGRIMEIGPDGKKRWDISSLQYPTDAVVIPGDRVIVAEQNTNHISERDIKTGKENWGEDFNQPIGLQRLANGNLVVIGRHQIVEWDHARKELKKITRPQSDIVAGAKLRDGQFLAFTQMGLFVTYDKDGKYVSQFKVTPRPGMWSTMQVLPDGKVLITQMGGVSEVDLNKKEAVMVMTHNNPMSAQRLPNGNILVTGQNNTLVTEYDPRTKKSVWDFRLIDNNNGFYRPLRAKRR